MKKTIELDQRKIQNIMRLTGIKTQREAVDFALTEGERVAKVLSALEGDLFVTKGQVIDPNYDLIKLRGRDLPRKRDANYN